MRALLVGLSGSPEVLRNALKGVLAVGDCLVRHVGGRAWAELPRGANVSTVARLAERVGPLTVVDVEMAGRGRGEDVIAERYVVPSSAPHEDVTTDARELLHDLAANQRGALLDERVLFEVAWDLVEPDEARRSEETSENLEDRWAATLVARLVATAAIELRGRLKPTGEIAHHLQWADDADFSERLLDVLVSSTAIAEVFLDAGELEAILRDTRPSE